MFGTIFCVFEASIMLFGTMYFALSQSKNWLYIAMTGYIMQLISLVGICFLPESPKFLIEKNRMREARKSLEKIAIWNKKRLVFNPSDFVEDYDAPDTPPKSNK